MYCTHESAHLGLDAAYCPDCQQTFDFGNKTYEQILKCGSGREPPENTESSVADKTRSSKGLDVGEKDASPERVSSNCDSAHSHQFTLVWQSDCTLVSQCSCGEKRECNIKELRELLRNCIIVRSEYLRETDKSSSKSRQQEFARAIADKDKQIAQVESQIKERSHFKQSSPSPSTIPLDEIRRDGGTQPRAAIDLKHVGLLEEQMEDGKELDPVTVFYDGESYWLADGYHRFSAHSHSGKEAISCIIHSGSRRDAVLYSVGANADHKPVLPRSREDKRRAVMTLLQDPEWGKWTDSQIARQCHVNQSTVSRIRSSLMQCISDNQERTYITKHGTRSKMNTVNIGKKSPTLPENLLDSTVTERGYHPLFPDQSGKITQLPILDSATVELDTGERDLKPTVAHHLNLNEGGLVEINAHAFNKIDGRRGRIAAVHSHSVEVWLRDVDTMVMQKHTLKYQQVTPLPLEKEPQLKEVCDRLTKLRACNLDPFLVEILNLLERNVVLTPL